MKHWRPYALAGLVFGAVYLVDTIVRPPVDLMSLFLVVCVGALLAWFAYFIVDFARWREQQLRQTGRLHPKRRSRRPND